MINIELRNIFYQGEYFREREENIPYERYPFRPEPDELPGY